MPVIQFFGVGRAYSGEQRVEALKPADLTVCKGEYVTVVGPSGSGKTTFLNVVGLLDRPSCGRYELDGIDVGRISERDRTALRGRRIGFVFQDFHLLRHRCVWENVAMAQLYTESNRRQRRMRAFSALEEVGLGRYTYALPETLSGGERQRVAIARALVNEPSLLLCDEPTGNLDTATANVVLGQIGRVHDLGYTVIVITHDPLVAQRGQRVLTIRDGILT